MEPLKWYLRDFIHLDITKLDYKEKSSLKLKYESQFLVRTKKRILKRILIVNFLNKGYQFRPPFSLCNILYHYEKI